MLFERKIAKSLDIFGQIYNEFWDNWGDVVPFVFVVLNLLVSYWVDVFQFLFKMDHEFILGLPVLKFSGCKFIRRARLIKTLC